VFIPGVTWELKWVKKERGKSRRRTCGWGPEHEGQMLISGEGKGGASQLGLPAFCCVDSVIQWYKNFSLEYPRMFSLIIWLYYRKYCFRWHMMLPCRGFHIFLKDLEGFHSGFLNGDSIKIIIIIIIIIILPKLHWNLRYVSEISSRHSTKII
jgi:hypothetical protein